MFKKIMKIFGAFYLIIALTVLGIAFLVNLVFYSLR